MSCHGRAYVHLESSGTQVFMNVPIVRKLCDGGEMGNKDPGETTPETTKI